MTTTNLPRPGHLGGDLREAFQEQLEQAWPNPYGDPELRRLGGQLWSCSDTLPAADCEMLDLPAGSTYAQAARALCRYWKVARAAPARGFTGPSTVPGRTASPEDGSGADSSPPPRSGS